MKPIPKAALSPRIVLSNRPLPHSRRPFHSGESRNLCGDSRIRRQATIAIFRFAENSRCRENEIPAFAGMEGRENGKVDGRRK